jgi:hypothetical protein
LDFSLSRLVFGPELPLPGLRARQCQPHMPGPGQTRCAYSSGAFLAPAAVAEVVGTVSASGAPLRRSGTTAFRLRFTVTTHGPFRPFMKSARCPGRMLRIVGTHPVEVRSFVKIALRRAGCGRSVSVAIEWSASPERAGLIRVDRIPIDFYRSRESTTPRHLVFACESRLPEEGGRLKREQRFGCGNVVEFVDCCGLRWKTRLELWNLN